MPEELDDHVSGDIRAVQRRFAEFADTHPELALYRAISGHVATDRETAALLTVAQPGQARPVLWFAALHDLVLRRPEVTASRWYASAVGRENVAEGDPWPDVRETVLEHADELREVIATRTTQTNEVNRTVYLAPAMALAAANLPDMPLLLVEMGASAGLLLNLDRYRTELTSRVGRLVLGDASSTVRCTGEDRSTMPVSGLQLPPIGRRVGLDLHPIRPGDVDQIRWLEACLWPDVPARVERFRAALGQLEAAPPELVGGDMVDDLEAVVARVGAAAHGQATHTLVFSSWALTYVPPDRRTQVAATMSRLAAEGNPVSWVTAEPTGCAPGIEPQGAGDTTVLGLRRWRSGRELAPTALGTCHPHGEWVDLLTP